MFTCLKDRNLKVRMYRTFCNSETCATEFWVLCREIKDAGITLHWPGTFAWVHHSLLPVVFPFLQQTSLYPTCGIFLLPQFPLLLFLLNCSYPLLVLLLFVFICSLADIIQSMASCDDLHPWVPVKIYVFSLDLSPELQAYSYNSFLSIFIRRSVSFLNLTCESITGDIFSSPSLYHWQGSQWWPPAIQLFELQAFGIFDLSLCTHSHVQCSENESFHLSLKNRSHIGHGRGKTDGKGTRSHFLGYKNCFTFLVEYGFHVYKHLSKWIRLCVEDTCLAVGKLHLSKQWQKRCLSPREHRSPLHRHSFI